jgi:hypothetical protein
MQPEAHQLWASYLWQRLAFWDWLSKKTLLVPSTTARLAGPTLCSDSAPYPEYHPLTSHLV